MRLQLQLIFIAALLLAAAGVHAQSLDLSANLGYGEIINPTVRPQYPRPGENVNVRIESSTVNLETSDITWKVDGAVKKRGIGETSFDTIAGKLGSRSVITAEVTALTGRTSVVTIPILVTTIDLIWEADTFTPPFYKGKAMYSRDSTLRVIALPHISSGSGTETSPSALVYKWSINGLMANSQSGYGKNEIVIPSNDLNKNLDIKVTASTLDGDRSAENSIRVGPIAPKILVYENHPLYGVLLERAINDDTELTSREMSLIAYPYYFTSQPPNRLAFEWKMNGRAFQGEEDGKKITFRNADGSAGRTSISLSIRHLDRIFQFANTSFRLFYAGS